MRMDFQLISDYQPTGDQPQAITTLTKNINQGISEQVLLGVTGSGKTFTMANVVAQLNRPTLVISHNKTLAAQLYQEFKSFFPKNAVSYFVSYYDYYQPEAYIPQSDTYIEKETEINEEIDKLRLAATTNLLTRKDTLIVSSVSCIYNIGSPKEYGSFILEMRAGMEVTRESILARLVNLQYERSDYGFHRGTFRVRGDTLDLFPAYADTAVRIEHDGKRVTKLRKIDPLTGNTIEELSLYVLYPAKHYMTDPQQNKAVFKVIEADLEQQIQLFKSHQKLLEAQRIQQKVRFDLEMIQELGYVNGIENYSRYFDGRNPGDAPYTLFDYYQETYGNEWLLIIDESHMTVPQIRGMYNGDRARKEVLVNFGFRLPAALDNRPLRFDEFLRRIPQTVYVSATPAQWEVERAQHNATTIQQLNNRAIEQSVVGAKKSLTVENGGAQNIPAVIEQLIRPTGLIDPEVTIRPVGNQVANLEIEIRATISNGQRVLVTTLTKRMAEDLSTFFEEKGIKVHYLHSDVLTLERSDILDDLRAGKYDVIVGINLLREGLDLPEVSLVAILDADKEGFLRSEVSLIQTMGRAARHVSGRVIMYADVVTGSMQRAIAEVKRRREIQLAYNQKHNITPTGISKPIRDKLVTTEETVDDPVFGSTKRKSDERKLLEIKDESLTPQDAKRLIKKLETEMRHAAANLDFEFAAELRDRIRELKQSSML